ncbi:hypothetical protein A5320_19375 [Rheinheimera sp. SA_1]|uniref:DUF3083 family protein n=1 Tax=Rheinheimera sp. SA_1 TaxID=1827365 RepID=UPI0007FBF14F|nr:DUF3083 family protein [Rheinheimera sp. SA_1]OBP13214.1 hypothetical protein A5320_19375 [Rheinheimera sp. SA_1]
MAFSTQHKVYIPDTAKDSQYMLAEFQLSQAFFACYPDETSCYRQLSLQFFKLADAAGLTNVHFIANDKMPVVRFHTEAFCFQTADQMLFFYNPAYHEAQHCWSASHYRARKISLLCLATGAEIRNKAAEFHQRVRQVILDFKALLPLTDIPVKIRDHQHLSYDLFARAKGCDSSFGYKLRSLPARYLARGTAVPVDHHTMSYAAVSLPLCRELKQRLLAEATTGYANLYQNLEQQFVGCAEAQHLTRLAFIADGSTPLVRNRQLDKPKQSPELTMLSFDTSSPQTQLISQWQADQLVDTAHLLLIAGQDDNTEFGYGRFMNQVEQSLHALAQQLGLQPEKQDLTVRFHQHLSYLLP